MDITGQQDPLNWQKSTYSAYNGSCVEVAFRKPSHSMANGNCVEVGNSRGGCGMVHVRDSKDPSGPSLSFRPAEWAAFLTTIRVTGG